MGNINVNRWELTYAPGVSVFLFFPVLFPGGCESMWVAALTVILPCALFLCVAVSFTIFTVRCCYTVDWVLLFTVCSCFYHCIVVVHCEALVVLLIGVILLIAIPLQWMYCVIYTICAYWPVHCVWWCLLHCCILPLFV